MSEVRSWDTVADNNRLAPPNGFPWSPQFNELSRSSREVMAALARYQRSLAGITTTGAGGAYVLTVPEAITALAVGHRFIFLANHASIDGVNTLEVNGLAAETIVLPQGGNLRQDDIAVGSMVEVVFDGTNFQAIGGLHTVTEVGDLGLSTDVETFLGSANLAEMATNLDLQADEVEADLTALGAGGTPPDPDVQAALDYIVSRLNLKLQSVSNEGSGTGLFDGIDATDPTDRTLQLRSIAGANGEEFIDVTLNGSTIDLTATVALLRDIASVGAGASLVNNTNNAGTGEVRSLTSDLGQITIDVESNEVDLNIADDSITPANMAIIAALQDFLDAADIATARDEIEAVGFGEVLLGLRFLTGTTSVVPPAGANSVFYILIGGGGGCGGYNSTSQWGGGGGEGGGLVVAADLSFDGSTATCTIGASGANGSNGAVPTAGVDGGDTTYLGSTASGGDGGDPGGAGSGGARGDGEATGTVAGGHTGSGRNGNNGSNGGNNAANALATGKGGDHHLFGMGSGGGGAVGGTRIGAQGGGALIMFFG